MSKAHARVRREAERWSAGGALAGQGTGWAAVQAEGQSSSVAQGTNPSFPLLSSIMDPGLSLERTAQAAQVRHSLLMSLGHGVDTSMWPA